jgi:hypothetical protein
MAEAPVTRAYYTNRANALLRNYARWYNAATTLDASRSSLQFHGGATVTTITPDISPGTNVIPYAQQGFQDLSSGKVRGLEIKNMVSFLVKTCSRIRKVGFYWRRDFYQFQHLPGGGFGVYFYPITYPYGYGKRAFHPSGASDASRTLENAAFYTNLDDNQTISKTLYDQILTQVRTTVAANLNKHYRNYAYCHSNCYANINTQRVRR